MKSVKSIILSTIFLSASALAGIGTYAPVTIKAITAENVGGREAVVVLSNNEAVYIDSGDKSLLSVALAAFMAGKKVGINYFDDTSVQWWVGPTIGGSTQTTYKLHRIDVLK